MKSWDIIVAGAGVIGLSLAWTLQKRGAQVLVIDRGEPAREASFAAAGMIASCDPHLNPRLRPLAERSAGIYPEFVHQLEDESRTRFEFHNQGTIAFFHKPLDLALYPKLQALDARGLEALDCVIRMQPNAYFLRESWIEPRGLCLALLAAFRHRGGDVVTGSAASTLDTSGGYTAGIQTEHTHYSSKMVVNCCGAWAGHFGPEPFPVRPIKGQMLSVVPAPDSGSGKPLLRHVVRTPGVYLVPRADGRIVIGSTLEETGFDKRVDPSAIQALQQAAAEVVPGIACTRMHDAWAGLRPGTPDGLPILGETGLRNYFVATGHFRDGILLAPGTAESMASLLLEEPSIVDLAPFAPSRFQR